MFEVNVDTPVCPKYRISLDTRRNKPLIATPKVYLNFWVFTGLQAAKSWALRPEKKIRQEFSVPTGIW